MLTYLYVGTGPISLIDAMIRHDNGNSVLAIDHRNEIGGAWVAIDVGGYGRLEIGCHIWSYNRKAYDFIESYLDLDLVPMDPQPYFLKRGVRISYDRKNIMSSSLRIFKYIKNYQFRKILTDIRNNPGTRFPIFSQTYLYPKGGARELQRSLVDRANQSALQIECNKKVSSLIRCEDKWLAVMDTGEKLLSKNVVITATSELREIVIDGEKIEIEHDTLNYTHFHLVIDGGLVNDISYVRVLDHWLIHRISDVSNQLPDGSDNYNVLLIGLIDKNIPVDKTKDEIVEILFNYLLKEKILGDGAEIIYSQLNRFETNYISSNQIEVLEALEGLEVLRTTDLMYGVFYKLPDWEYLTGNLVH